MNKDKDIIKKVIIYRRKKRQTSMTSHLRSKSVKSHNQENFSNNRPSYSKGRKVGPSVKF
jgi:hypothetical protein